MDHDFLNVRGMLTFKGELGQIYDGEQFLEVSLGGKIASSLGQLK